MGQKTPLHQIHQQANAKIVDFGGWDMPLHYGSQIEEHHHVRRSAGVFDVSHMTIVDITGSQSKEFLERLLANDIGKLTTSGKALYSCMLNPEGGVIDDLITYFFAADDFRLIVNASTREKDLAWINKQAASHDVVISERTDLAMIAVQGPEAISKIQSVLPEDLATGVATLKPFAGLRHEQWFIARTGYTGEDGVEICLPSDQVADLWSNLVDSGVFPCGLGARDTLRLEAGMNLYGNDMDESTTPLESGLAWTVEFKDRDDRPRGFIGAQSLRDQLTRGVDKKLTGIVLEGRGVLRSGYELFSGDQSIGRITSGGFGPTLERSIGFARVLSEIEQVCEVEIRGKRLPVRLTKLPFVRRGKVLLK